MKVFNIIFEDRLGGATKRIIKVAENLKNEGVETTIVFPNRNGNATKLAKALGLEVITIDIHKIPNLRHVWNMFSWIAAAPKEIMLFYRLLRVNRPDVVHLNGAFFITPAIATRFLGIPLVWHLNDVVIPKNLSPFFGRLVRFMSSRVVVSSVAVANHYSITDKYFVVYPPLIEKEPQILSNEKNIPTIGILANWNPLKGFEYFFHACSLVKKEIGNDLNIVIAGSKLETHKNYYNEMQNLIDEYFLRPLVRDYGFISDVGLVLAELDVLVVSSISEAFSMSALEAISEGVPVVAFDVGGIGEVIGRGDDSSGVLVTPKDAFALADGILTILQDKNTSKKMGVAGMKRANRMFSMQVCVQSHKKVYQSVL